MILLNEIMKDPIWCKCSEFVFTINFQIKCSHVSKFFWYRNIQKYLWATTSNSNSTILLCDTEQES